MPLGQRVGDNSESRYGGTEVAFSNEIHITLSCNLAGGFDFIVAPLTNPNYRPSKDQNINPSLGEPVLPFAGSDLVLSPSQWSSHVVGKISPWIDFDSDNQLTRLDSEIVFKKEISWASHLSLQACLLPTPREFACENYARCVNQTLQNLSNMQLWLRIPLIDVREEMHLNDENEAKNVSNKKKMYDYYELMNKFRSLCEYHNQLSIALDITASLPSNNYIEKWIGEPLKAAFIHTSAFLTNKRGYPCLSKRHQNLISKLFNHSIQVVITGQSLHQINYDDVENPESSENGWEDKTPLNHPLRPYLEYISHLYAKLDPFPDQEKFEIGYRDFLQAPLQPLMDNLEAQTYETFERDATKYSQYQLAIYEALIDSVSDDLAETKTTILMVVGAGRGPLVRAALQAAQEASRKLKIYAVEKNPNAVVTLHNLVAMEGWKDVVTIVSCDMREWEAPELADILVSELLGSFGDNELSPECLDGAQRFLKKNGISIPSSYTSYIGPITASKLYNDVKAYGDLAHFETAYVVKLHNISKLCEPQPVFTFVHPNNSLKIDNRRFEVLTFKLPSDTGSATVHGFGGYFDAILYKEVHLGIVPSFPTPNMFSWFPIFFPLRQPILVSPGDEIQLSFWRCVGKSKVWYEWAVSSPSVSPIHNPNGRSYWVGL